MEALVCRGVMRGTGIAGRILETKKVTLENFPIQVYMKFKLCYVILLNTLRHYNTKHHLKILFFSSLSLSFTSIGSAEIMMDC